MKFQLNVGAGLFIGIPTLGRPVPLDWALSFKNTSPGINYNTIFCCLKGLEIGAARNEMAKQAIEKNCKYLYFLGDDVVPPHHALRSMLYKMDNREEIGVIGGVYCAKADPAFPLVFRGNGRGPYWDWKIGEFFEVSGLGMDCTIIRVDLLKKLFDKNPDMFKTVKSDQFMDGIASAEEYTEDLYFLKRVQEETDYKIFCDGGIICDHWDVREGRKYSVPSDSLPMRQKVVNGELKKLLDLGGKLPPQPGWEIITAGEEQEEGQVLDYRCDYRQLPFDNDSFDGLNATNVFTNQHFVSPVLEEAFRVVKLDAEVKISYSGWINQEWLRRCAEQVGFTVTKNNCNLLELVKTQVDQKH